MVSRLPSQCHFCIHFRSPLDTGLKRPSCDAFPEAIPDALWWNEADHREPFPNDHGVHWEPRNADVEFPEYAMEDFLQKQELDEQ